MAKTLSQLQQQVEMTPGQWEFQALLQGSARNGVG
jgi:hypothetical protein